MANIKNGIVGYLEGVRGLPGKDGNPGVWVGTEPPESSEYEVWVNPTGEPFTAEWENVENKPFETLSDDFEVDSDGVLSVVGGSGGASSWEDLEDKPFEYIGTGLSVDIDGGLNATGSGSPEISIGSDTPTGDEVLWINDNPSSVNVPQIDDANISLVDTWSSSKIVSEIPVIAALTEEEYEDLGSEVDPDTFYFIYEE